MPPSLASTSGMANKDRSFLAVKQKRQDGANHQPFGEGQGQVLVLAEAKTLPHPFVEGLVLGDGSSNLAGGFGFFSHASMMPTALRKSPEALPPATAVINNSCNFVNAVAGLRMPAARPGT